MAGVLEIRPRLDATEARDRRGSRSARALCRPRRRPRTVFSRDPGVRGARLHLAGGGMSMKDQKPEKNEKTTQNEKPKNLDELIQVLDQDQLRHVVGGLRPKGRPA